ncbi:D-alanyl-D-alanine carboxypeptidase/D-alanyl-D-alanine endopeptidase [Glycomyces xiaoerkulensis]|uniref:D-alanyl-D-alanine carboxypeptidase/D-alanyl-D-alanine endopeptidase n=1 Tax=Glycomyces xiaoerkulensis TaxID=2038139 RepID=UPI000C2571EC|nr:D-alanyl-D-alanine carboxypeptidase/D-alanyl-D-alanine-endopeptidase [Glycomyces xiaoerkulensis]
MALSDNADPEGTSSAPQARPEDSPSKPRPSRARGALAWLFSTIAVIGTLTVAAVLVWQIDAMSVPDRGAFTAPEAYPPDEPAEVLAAFDQDAPAPDLASALPELLSDERFDGDLSAVFADAATGSVLYEQRGSDPLSPASSMKLVSAVAAYEHLGPEYRIETSVVEGADDDTVVLVAGGDITLTVDGQGYYGAGGSLTDLAEQVLEARGGEAPSTVVLDTDIFTDDELAAGVDGNDLPYVARAAPIMIDGGRIGGDQKYFDFYDDPAQAALERFAELLGAPDVGHGTAPEDAGVLGSVHSQPVAGLVDSFVLTSDNGLADAVAFQTALAVEGEMTWDAIDRAHRALLEGFGADTADLVLEDGSGLSERNRMTAEAFSLMLLGAADTLASTVFESMPVAGYSGTLDDRFDGAEDGWGLVRAKTGTLSGVSSLTGSLTTADGNLIVFSLISNEHSNTSAVQDAMDDVTTAVALCGC